MTSEQFEREETPSAAFEQRENEESSVGSRQRGADDTFEARVQASEAQIVKAFQMLVESMTAKGTGTSAPGASTSPQDDSIETQLRNTKAQVVRLFQKLLRTSEQAFGSLDAIARPSHQSDQTIPGPTQDAETHEAAGAPNTRGGGTKGPAVDDDDDSIEVQMRRTSAQVIGTFKGLGSVFQQAEQMIKDRTSAKKEV